MRLLYFLNSEVLEWLTRLFERESTTNQGRKKAPSSLSYYLTAEFNKFWPTIEKLVYLKEREKETKRKERESNGEGKGAT